MGELGFNSIPSELFDAYTSIYEAGVRPDLWPDCLSQVQSLFDNASAMISIVDFKCGRSQTWLHIGIERKWVRAYDALYCSINPWLQQEKLLRSPGTVYVGEELASQDDLIRSRFYDEWLEPQELRYSLHGVLFRENREVCLYSMLRGSEAGQFKRAEIKTFHLILPQLQRAIEINRTISDLQSARQNAENALDRFAVGVILLDDQGKVLEANRRARQLCKQRDGLSIQHNKLQPSSSRDASDLHRLIVFALQSAQAGGDETIRMLPISRPSGRRPFTLLVSSLGSTSNFLNEKRSAAAIFLVDPEQQEQFDHASLRQLYRLTRSESRVAAGLASGQRLEDVARDLGVQPGTARSHLRNIFSKTGCECQSDLRRLLLVSTAHIINSKDIGSMEPDGFRISERVE